MRTLPFTMQRQEESEWCWSAVTTSIDRHFNPSSIRTQCQTASDELAAICCPSPLSPGTKLICNIPKTVNKPLRKLGWLDAEPVLPPPLVNQKPPLSFPRRPLSFAAIRTEIDNNRPVVVLIKWRKSDQTIGKLGHFFVIFGYDEITEELIVEDPMFFESRLSYARIASHAIGDGYQDGKGVWFASFLLRRTPGQPTRTAVLIS